MRRVHELETGIAPKRELRGVCGGPVFVWGVFRGLSPAPIASVLLVNGALFRVPCALCREGVSGTTAREGEI